VVDGRGVPPQKEKNLKTTPINPGDLLLTNEGGLFVVEGEPMSDGTVPCSHGDIAGVRHPIDVTKEHIRSIFAGSQP
jgi:hypothetical protein